LNEEHFIPISFFIIGLHVFKRDVVKSWRLEYPHCLIGEEKIISKIYDIVLNDVTEKFNAEGEKLKGKLLSVSREFVWDDYSCDSLLRCFQGLMKGSKPHRGPIEEELRQKFIARFPHCPLSSSVLFSKLFILKIVQVSN